MDSARKLATYADLAALPEGEHHEIVGGSIHSFTSGLPRHSRAQGALFRRVGGSFDDDDGHGGPGGWWILLEMDVRLGPNDIVRPDLAGWRRDRLDIQWDQRPIDTRPDWICEVISPSNAGHDRVKKRRLYARYGVPFYWIVDPAERTLEALALQPRDDREAAWLEVGVFDHTSIARIAPFEAIEIDVGRLFPPEAPSTTEP